MSVICDLWVWYAYYMHVIGVWYTTNARDIPVMCVSDTCVWYAPHEWDMLRGIRETYVWHVILDTCAWYLTHTCGMWHVRMIHMRYLTHACDIPIRARNMHVICPWYVIYVTCFLNVSNRRHALWTCAWFVICIACVVGDTCVRYVTCVWYAIYVEIYMWGMIWDKCWLYTTRVFYYMLKVRVILDINLSYACGIWYAIYVIYAYDQWHMLVI